MITVIHGDDIVSSRSYFIDKHQKAKDPLFFEGEKITLTELIQAFEGNTLFSKEKNIFIEKLYEKRKSKKEFEEITSYLKKTTLAVNVYIWEDKTLSREELYHFSKADVKTFKIPQNIFLFLDSIKPNNYKDLINLFHKVLKDTKEEVVFSMIVRQFRLLLALHEKSADSIDEAKRLAPWQKSKFEKQVGLFDHRKLKNCYKKLYQIDYAQKTGALTTSLGQAIDFFLLEI